MRKTEAKIGNQRENPFLTDRADALWESLDKQGKRLTKDELLKRSKIIKEKN
jgi:hypothetical protein